MKRIFKYSAIVFTAFIAFIVLINLWVVWRASGLIYTAVDQVPRGKVGLLLGTSATAQGGFPNVFFTTRIKAAADLYKAGKIQKIIVSGDNGHASYNETDDMRAALVSRGVDPRDIVNDHAGFRTLDSVYRAKSVFGQDEIIVISQRFHIQRAIFIARAHGIKAAGYAAADPAHRGPYWKVMFREYFARVKAFLDCYILGTQPKFPGPAEPIVFD